MSVRDKPLQCMHSPEKAQVCEGQAKVCTVLRREGQAIAMYAQS